MQQVYKVILGIGLLLLPVIGICYAMDYSNAVTPLAMLAAILVALGLNAKADLKSYRYTAWIIVAIVCGMCYPGALTKWGSLDLRNPWLILVVVQLVMFGMGTQMSLADFTNVKKMGKGVLIGLLCQFTIMPLVGFTLTLVFDFEPEIAAGIILIGCCSSGLASNVMSYIARANLPLSITLTAMATVVAPFMTPLLMRVLAGTYVEIHFLDMCFQIVKIVLVPIGSALLFDYYKQAGSTGKKVVNSIGVLALGWLLTALFLWSAITMRMGEVAIQVLVLVNFVCGSVLFGVVFYYLYGAWSGIKKVMPVISMIGIIYFTGVTTAASRDNLLDIGLLLIIISVLHNSLGYVLGYSISKLLGLDKISCRTIAFEVGMQNGGMASGLAGLMGKLATLGLAAAVFSPYMNISGSILANYWKRKSIIDKEN